MIARKRSWASGRCAICTPRAKAAVLMKGSSTPAQSAPLSTARSARFAEVGVDTCLTAASGCTQPQASLRPTIRGATFADSQAPLSATGTITTCTREDADCAVLSLLSCVGGSDFAPKHHLLRAKPSQSSIRGRPWRRPRSSVAASRRPRELFASASRQRPNQRARRVAPNCSFSRAYSRDGSYRWASGPSPLRKLTSTLLTSPAPNSA